VTLEIPVDGVDWMGPAASPSIWADIEGSRLSIPSELGTIPVSATGALPWQWCSVPAGSFVGISVSGRKEGIHSRSSFSNSVGMHRFPVQRGLVSS